MPTCKKCGKRILMSSDGLCGGCRASIAISERYPNGFTPKSSYDPDTFHGTCRTCYYCIKSTSTVEKQNLTNMVSIFSGAGVVDYAYVDNYTCSKFKFNVTDRLSMGEKCTSYITPANYEKKCLNGEMEKDKPTVNIILDFSSLKDVMAKGGLVMTTYKCPNCNGMVKLPENGKVLMCEYCGTPIKPVDVFEKIKTLIS